MQAAYKAVIPRSRQFQWSRKSTSKEKFVEHEKMPAHQASQEPSTSWLFPLPTTSKSIAASLLTSYNSSSPMHASRYKLQPSVSTPITSLSATPTISPLLLTSPILAVPLCDPATAIPRLAPPHGGNPILLRDTLIDSHHGKSSTPMGTRPRKSRYRWKRRLSSSRRYVCVCLFTFDT